VERFNRKLEEGRLTGAIFFDVPNSFDAVWVEGLF
jgi:hypothetical protein